MSVDRIRRFPRRISRRTAVNTIGGLFLAGAAAYAFGESAPSSPSAESALPKPVFRGTEFSASTPPRVSAPASLSVPPTSDIGTRGITGNILYPAGEGPYGVATINEVRARPGFIGELDGHGRDTAVRIPGTSEITNIFPDAFNFSNDIKEAGLIPSVFFNENTQERIRRSVSYIGKLHDFLSKRPEYKGPTLLSLGINAPQNFPIAFEKNVTLYDVLEDFLKSQMFGTVNLDPAPQVGVNFHLGTSNLPEFKNGKWELTARTQLNTKVLDEKVVLEDLNTAYYQTTDLQLALKLLHEFCHFKQDQAIMTEILKDPIQAKGIGQDQNKMLMLIAGKVAVHKERIAKEINLDVKEFAPNEAQANTISQLFLETLNRINKTNRVPGAEDDDPFPRREDSLLNRFRVQVLGNHALDKRWLLAHNW